MDLIEGMEESIERIWEPVIKPPRTPVSNDILGYKYIHTENGQVYRRKDMTLRTFDNLKLVYTCYFRLKKSNNDSCLVSSSFQNLGWLHISSFSLF